MRPITLIESKDSIKVSIVCWMLFVGDSVDINLNSIYHDPSEHKFEVIL
jgi:hypothetical protein